MTKPLSQQWREAYGQQRVHIAACLGMVFTIAALVAVCLFGIWFGWPAVLLKVGATAGLLLVVSFVTAVVTL